MFELKTSALIKSALGVGFLSLVFGGGWYVRGLVEDRQQLAVERAANAIRDAAIQRESAIAAKVEERLASLSANQTVIDRGIIRETEKPVYRNVCLGDDVVRLLNAAAAGADPTAEPAGEVSRGAGNAD